MRRLNVKARPPALVKTAKRKADDEGPVPTDGHPAKRHQSIADSLVYGFTKLLSPRRLDDLPQEILLNIFQHFAEPWVLTDDLADWKVYTLDLESRTRQQTLVALTKTCRRLNQPATSILYRCAHLPTTKSLLSFLKSLSDIQPRLTELVKQVACPQDVLMTVVYAFQVTNSAQKPKVINAGLLAQPSSQPIGNFHPVNEHSTSYNTHYRSYVDSYALYRILKLVPAIRALSISCCTPWHTVYPATFPSKHLSKLSIAMDRQPECYMRGLNAADNLILAFLNSSNLGRYRALKQLELVHPRGKWIANLVTVEAATGSGIHETKKYVASLNTLWRNGGGTAEWDLLSLERGIFSPAYLHTLDYAGQRRLCSGACSKVQASGWDLNRFLATKGRRIKTLNLDWEHEHVQLGQLGPAGMLTSLPMLTNLTHLTVSMQILFRQHIFFSNELQTILKDPAAELARMLPAPLRVLRVSEYIPGVLRPRNQDAEDRSVKKYNGILFEFVELLRAHWLDARGDRELWFRHCLKFERHPRMADERSRCMLRWLVSSQRHQDVGREFAQVYRMLPLAAAVIRNVNEAG